MQSLSVESMRSRLITEYTNTNYEFARGRIIPRGSQPAIALLRRASASQIRGWYELYFGSAH